MFDPEPITLELLKSKRLKHPDYYYNQVHAFLTKEEYKDLGWLNSGIIAPKDVVFVEQYSNSSGSSCLYVNHETKQFYSVDMGD